MGCSVAAVAIETSGTTRQAKPKERTNGIGTKMSVAKLMATVRPEITAVRPEVRIVSTRR